MYVRITFDGFKEALNWTSMMTRETTLLQKQLGFGTIERASRNITCHFSHLDSDRPFTPIVIYVFLVRYITFEYFIVVAGQRKFPYGFLSSKPRDIFRIPNIFRKTCTFACWRLWTFLRSVQFHRTDFLTIYFHINNNLQSLYLIYYYGIDHAIYLCASISYKLLLGIWSFNHL